MLKLINQDDALVQRLIDKGKLVIQYEKRVIEQCVDRWNDYPLYIELLDDRYEPIRIPILNCAATNVAGEVCMKLTQFSKYYVGATFTLNNVDSVTLSLRSVRELGIDVSKVANATTTFFNVKRGGGHKHAAGLSLPLSIFTSLLR